MTALHLPELVEQTRSGIFYFTDERLFETSGVRIAFTGRAGGVSEPPFDSLNLASHVNDASAAVEENRRRVLEALKASDSCEIVALNQVHGVEIVTISEEAPETLALSRAKAQEGADGVAVSSSVRDVATMLCFADCVPLAFVAPDGSFALAHAGWRGVMGEIAAAAIARLCDVSGCSDAAGINVYIGPHIHSECFEVSEELACQFGDKFGCEVVADARHVDLAKAIRVTLAHAGISPERVADVGVCTVCDSERFFSYRASGGRCGRHSVVAFHAEAPNGAKRIVPSEEAE